MSLPELSAPQRAVYTALLRTEDCPIGATPSQVANLAALVARTAGKVLFELEELGLAHYEWCGGTVYWRVATSGDEDPARDALEARKEEDE